jgi:predicted metal-dependent hydrolase
LKVNPDGSVCVSAPSRLSREYIEEFVKGKSKWIQSILSKKSDGPFLSLACNDGDKITVLGDTYTIKLIIADKNGVQIDNENLNVFVLEKHFQKRCEILKSWLKSELEKIVNASLIKWYKQTGLDCSKVCYKDMKSRWGSCNVVTKKLCFSLRLITQKIESVDYVVLHELVHTIFRYHDKKFYGYVAKYMSNYKQHNKDLKMPIVK